MGRKTFRRKDDAGSERRHAPQDRSPRSGGARRGGVRAPGATNGRREQLSNSPPGCRSDARAGRGSTVLTVQQLKPKRAFRDRAEMMLDDPDVA